jgi:PAT family beta-lactamase induction signal transducer AmpG
VLQAATNLLYSWLAVTGHSMPVMIVAVGVDNLAGAMGATVFGAFIMALCDPRFSAFQFAILSSLSATARSVMGPIAAAIVGTIGWPRFFVVTFLAASPGLIALWWLRGRLTTLDTDR